MKVADNYRTNSLSLKPGGCTIVVEYNNGHIFEYDKIKNPDAYIRKIKKNRNVVNAWIKE